jgi:ethanolamine utilization cobalamin adenosyltransferase
LTSKGVVFLKLITETILREELKNNESSGFYCINKDDIITPAAKQYLADNKIKLVKDNESIQQGKYINYRTRDVLVKKPEQMTHIYGNELVYKDHPRIVFRGKLDSFQSVVLKMQVIAESKKIHSLVKDLNEVLLFTREILKSEVLNNDLSEINLLGYDYDKIREISHNPQKYFNCEHMLLDYKMGEVLIELNNLRTTARELELTAVRAFRDKNESNRIDILKALNRLNSCIYIMMLRFNTSYYS